MILLVVEKRNTFINCLSWMEKISIKIFYGKLIAMDNMQDVYILFYYSEENAELNKYKLSKTFKMTSRVDKSISYEYISDINVNNYTGFPSIAWMINMKIS